MGGDWQPLSDLRSRTFVCADCGERAVLPPSDCAPHPRGWTPSAGSGHFCDLCTSQIESDPLLRLSRRRV